MEEIIISQEKGTKKGINPETELMTVIDGDEEQINNQLSHDYKEEYNTVVKKDNTETFKNNMEREKKENKLTKLQEEAKKSQAFADTLI